MKQTIKQAKGLLDPKTVIVEKDHDGDLYLHYSYDKENDSGAFYLDPHAGRQLYNAIGEVMGFSKVIAPRQSKPTPKGAQAYKGNGKHKWELVTADAKGAGHTYRLRVPGGWLYRTVSSFKPFDGETEGDIAAQSTVFVPVPNAVGYAV